MLCSGPRELPGTLQTCLQNLGLNVDAYDVVDGPSGDISDDAIWDDIMGSIRCGKYVALMAAPPCGSFSRLRAIPGGPPLLRSPSGPGRYGLSTNSPAQQSRIRLDNLLALRTCSAFVLFAEMGLQPAFKTGEVHMFNLDEYQTALKLSNVRHTVGVQCMFGGAAQKLTSLLSVGIDLSDFPSSCTHKKRPWFRAGSGEAVTCPHPPSRGSVQYFSTQSEALKAHNSSNFVSAALAHYPPLLNRYFSTKILLSITGTKSKPILSVHAVKSVHADAIHWDNKADKESVIYRQRLRGVVQPDPKVIADRLAVGGLRNTSASIKKLHCVTNFGQSMGRDIRRCLGARSDWVSSLCTIVGCQDDTVKAPQDAITAVRDIIVRHTAHQNDQRVRPPFCDTIIDAELLESWRRAANDPETQVGEWLITGSPAGVVNIPASCGIFPPADDVPEIDAEDLDCDAGTFVNYSGVDSSQVAEDTVRAYIDKGYVKAFDSYEELSDFVDGKPILNKIGIIEKKGKARMIPGHKAVQSQAGER